jgi:hypothetical protein
MMATIEQRNHAKSFLKKAEEYLASAEDNLGELGIFLSSRSISSDWAVKSERYWLIMSSDLFASSRHHTEPKTALRVNQS